MQLMAAHWVYLVGVVVIIATMIARKNIVVPAVVATFATALVFSHSVIRGLSAVFNASLVAATALFNIFLIIALVTAMLHSLQAIGADRKMVAPFRGVMRNGHLAFWTLVVVTYFISLFFWPTPAVPLIGAVLIPVAIRAGLRPMAVGLVVAIAGQGMALSSDYVIRVAPGLSAKAAGVDANLVADRAMVLSLVVGAVALAVAYLMEFRAMRRPDPALLAEWELTADGSGQRARDLAVTERERELVGAGDRSAGGGEVPSLRGGPPTSGHGVALREEYDEEPHDGTDDTNGYRGNPLVPTFFAIFVPVAYLALIVYMVVATFSDSVPDLRGGDAAALVGGIAALVVFLAALAGDGKAFLESSATHVVNGLVFAFKAMGVVLPIAGFFFIGNGDFSGQILGTADPAKGPALLYDLVTAAENHIPHSGFVAAFGILIIGMIAGLEGSGFSGLPLTGALAGSLGPAAGISAGTLAAVGQMGNIWSGGGTLVAWSSLIAVAGFARVPVIALARRCFIPVVSGLVAGTVFAVVFFG
ncbi:hypothetical protein ONA91_38910 [Micromonospora sp. DR5-3]|uniref:hypothetical protein n=1 Tax=unclassified Micromonospora TaxID=2617518 RepID=UPI0011D3F37C|nr:MULTISPECIES: hypothetical protein [unclassified Micromonospora]MCW3820418.1 hypothetical protein [Micromonospora sp. DR5-3]TYC19453.1 hypothetical protein FXF52_36485 [Micromonospora sp. MP36]